MATTQDREPGAAGTTGATAEGRKPQDDDEATTRLPSADDPAAP